MMGDKIIIFDCDGTLSNSHGVIVRAYHYAVKRHHVPAVSDDDIISTIGLHLEQSIYTLFPEVDYAVRQQIANDFTDYCMHHNSTIPSLFDGIMPMLDTLYKYNDANVALAIATGMGRYGLESLLRHHHIGHYFVNYKTADDGPSKPDPTNITNLLLEQAIETEHAIMIGDSVYDIIMAQRASIPSIGVTWGSHQGDDLRQSGASYVVDTVDECQKLLMAWLKQ